MRNGTPSDCNGKTFPGFFGSAQSFHYDQYSFPNNSGAAACIEISFSATTNMHSVAYLNSFNPADVSQNYLGDLGVQNTPGATETYSVSVPNGATLIIVVHEATANGGGDYTLAANCITAPPPLPTAGQLLISEFRLAGPDTGAGSQRDEFIELYNNTEGPLTIDRVVLQAYDPNFFGPADGSDFTQGFPTGTVIPARGHFLVGDSTGYSLPAYAALDFDTTPLFNGDFFIDNDGFRLISDDGLTVYDSVGFSGSGGRAGEIVSYAEGTPLPRRTQTAPTVQYAYVRRLNTGLPRDTNNNASDFALVAVTGGSFALAAGGTQPSTLGAPGPENSASPIQRNALVKASLIDPLQSSSSPPNRIRDATPGAGLTASGTLTLRRKFTNNTTEAIGTIRFRVVDITTLGTGTPGQADLRVVASAVADADITVTGGGTVPVKGTQVESPPVQASGGGLNSSIVTLTPATPIAPGGAINVESVLGVAATGTYRFFINTEVRAGVILTAPAGPVTKGANSKTGKQSGGHAQTQPAARPQQGPGRPVGASGATTDRSPVSQSTG